MTRKELYDHIKGLGLQEEVKAFTGNNYTNVPSDVLEKIVIRVLKSKECDCKKRTKQIEPPVHEEDCHQVDAVVALDRLIETLAKKKVLLQSEIEYILQINEN